MYPKGPERRLFIAMQPLEKLFHVMTEFRFSDDGTDWWVVNPPRRRHTVRKMASVVERHVIHAIVGPEPCVWYSTRRRRGLANLG